MRYARQAVAALTVHRTVIHYRSPSSPPSHAQKNGMPEWTFRVFCERAVKRCIKVGKNSKKVCDFALLTTRQIGICRLVVLIYFLNLKHIYGIYIGATENIIL